MSNRLVQLDVYHVRLPLKQPGVTGKSGQEDFSDSIVVAALLADGTMGLGQCLPRKTLTGETLESTIYHISHTFSPLMGHLEPKRFVDLFNFVDQLPFFGEQNQLILNARSCVELALLDVYANHFCSHLSNIIGWLGYAPFIACGSFKPPAVTAILDENPLEGLSRQLNTFRWRRFRDFKLFLGYDDDLERLQLVIKQLGKNIRTGSVSLRVDAQGRWDVDQAIDMGETLDRHGVLVLEQPLATDDQSHNRILVDLCQIPLMADESILTLDDGRRFAENDLVDFFNLSINKNGGLIPTIRLAELAAKTSRGFVLGGDRSEPAILSAAGLKFLQMVPDTLFTEIGYGKKVLRKDVVCPRVGFGFRGKLKTSNATGLGIELCRNQLAKFSQKESRKIHLA
jgi:L-alanine-DL-glutamate epimerase-like enolase superfamily enzyme